ncbi:hypothetical protein BBP40_004736 [Aspergillus hancockii]|nr:hypothetical protein BBP40_004736 [Aspergillus hancockii]
MTFTTHMTFALAPLAMLRAGVEDLAQPVVQAVKDGGMNLINLGAIPTPVLTCYALKHGKGSIMVTGSHIPFDRNGYRLNTCGGKLLKEDEQPLKDKEMLRNTPTDFHPLHPRAEPPTSKPCRQTCDDFDREIDSRSSLSGFFELMGRELPPFDTRWRHVRHGVLYNDNDDPFNV